MAREYLHGHVRRELNIPGVTFGGRYDGSPLIVGDGALPPPDAANSYTPTACPGGRPPHAWLADGRSLFDTFGTDWTLLVLGPEPPDTAAFEQAATTLGLPLQQVRHADPALRTLYEAPLCLIRPDHIVAWRGHTAKDALAVMETASGRGHQVT